MQGKIGSHKPKNAAPTLTASLLDKVLVVSPWVPRRDMNSGDLRLHSILEILSREYQISLVAGSYRPEDDFYISLLEKFGVTVYSKEFPLKKLLEKERFRIAILEFYSTAEYYLDRIKILQPDCRLIVDSVDVHFARLYQKYELTKDVNDFAAFQKTKKEELCIYRKADAVITVSMEDASAILNESPDIKCEIVPNIHEINLCDVRPEKNTLIFVGGFNHHPNVDAVLHFYNEILPLIKNEIPDIKFMVVGNIPPKEIRELENESVKVTGHVPVTSPYLHRSCISVAPLRYGAGMKGKIGEAMAHGVPVVTTSVGAQGMGLTDRKNVLIANSPRTFADAVVELLNDKSLYETIKKNAIQLINDKYIPEIVAQTMNLVLESVCERQGKRLNTYDKLVFFNNYIIQKVKSKLSL